MTPPYIYGVMAGFRVGFAVGVVAVFFALLLLVGVEAVIDLGAEWLRRRACKRSHVSPNNKLVNCDLKVTRSARAKRAP